MVYVQYKSKWCNPVPLYLKVTHVQKKIELHFYRLYSILAPKSLLALPQKYDTYFVAVVSVLLPICGQICQGMQYLCFFVEEVVQFLGTMTEKVGVNTSLWSELEHKQWPG